MTSARPNSEPSIALPERTLNTLSTVPAFAGDLHVNSTISLPAPIGAFVDRSPDVATTLLHTSKGGLRFVTEDPSLSLNIRKVSADVSFVCGDGYRGIAWSRNELTPWMLCRGRLSVGSPLPGAWQSVWTSGGLSYFARDGQTLRRLRMSPDGASLAPEWEVPIPTGATSVRELPGRNTLLFQLPRKGTCVAHLQHSRPGFTSEAKAPAWNFYSAQETLDTSKLAVSEGGFSIWQVSPPARESLGVRIDVARWTLGNRDTLEHQSITLPSSIRYADVAISPRCDLLAAIGDLSDGFAFRYLLHLYHIPSLTLIDSQIFENNIVDPATVTFSADGEVLLVQDASTLHSWTVADNPLDGIRKIGALRSLRTIEGQLATSRHVFLAEDTAQTSPEVTYKWLALSPKAETNPLDPGQYELVTEW